MSKRHGPRFYQSLYWRLAAGFIACVCLIGAGQVLISIYQTRRLVLELDQQMYWDLASEIAARLQPLVGSEFDRQAIEQELFTYAAVLPQCDFFLLDEAGHILAQYTASGAAAKPQIALDPIRRALAPLAPGLPLFGDDPIQPDRSVVFSAAPIVIAGREGYLYVTLESLSARYLRNTTGQFYIAASVLEGLAVVTAAGVLFGGLLFLYLSRRFRHVTEIVDGFRQGDFTQRADASGEDEVSILAETINSMADTITANTKALKMNDYQRRQLVARLAHDLRGPLTSAKGFIETLRQHGGELNDAERRSMLDSSFASLTAYGRLVDDLFELAKLEAREREPKLEDFPLEEAVHESVLSLQGAADEKGITLRVSAEENLPFVRADITMIGRVLYNLLQNALRHTPPGGSVDIAVTHVDGAVQCSIADTGEGIAEAELPFIFDSYFRTATSDGDDRTRSGAGLGLSIVKRIVELHSADISVRSTEGKGSVFTFSLPAAG